MTTPSLQAPSNPVLPALRSRTFWLLVLPLLWALAYLPALGTRALRLEEGRRATPAREMLQSGNFIQPTLYGEAYLNKPPMFFWIVAGTGALLGGDAAMTHGGAGELAVRLPSVLALLAGAYVICVFARKQLDRATRGVAALLLLAMVVCMDKGSLGEIESVLSLLVFAAMAAFWSGYAAAGRQTLRSWILTGVFLSLAMLTKGPPAIVQFYIPLIVFLIWQRDTRRLLSWGHAVCAAIVVLPMVAWVWAIRIHDPAAFDATVQNWMLQMGITKNAFGGGHGAGGGATVRSVVNHYLVFPLEAFIMLVPAIPFAIAAMAPRFFGPGAHAKPAATQGEAAESPQAADEKALRRYLTCAIFAASLFFWLWPSSRPRHMMAVCYPTAILGAIGLVGVALSHKREKIIQLACATLAIVLIGRGVVFAILASMQADQPRTVAATIVPNLPAREPIYTLITFQSRKADTVADLYNVQFYLGRRLVGLRSLDELPAGEPATVLMLTPDLAAAERNPALRVRVLAKAPLKRLPADQPLVAAEVLRTKDPLPK